MKQYLSPEQTAKLIELGFEKPKGWNAKNISSRFVMAVDVYANNEFNYSIGELIEMLPKEITLDDTKYSRVISENEVCYYSWTLEVYYYFFDIHDELIDNLFYMIVELKEEGVI